MVKTGFDINKNTFFLEFEKGKIENIPINEMAGLFFILKDMLNYLGEKQKIVDELDIELLEQPPYNIISNERK